MKALIIGGGRFMGPFVVEELVSAGHEVIVLNRGKSGTPPPGVSHIRGDRNELLELQDQLRRLRPDIVIDMMLVSRRQATDLVSVFAGYAARVVMASSCDVYLNYGVLIGVDSGQPADGPLTESAPLRESRYPYRGRVGPDNPLYDYDKILVEEVLQNEDSFQTTILRLPMVFGPGDYQHRLYPYVRRMDDNRPAIILEQGFDRTRLVRGYVRDCAHAIALAAAHPHAGNQAFNVAAQPVQTEREWIESIARAVGWKGKIVTIGVGELPDSLRSGLHLRGHMAVDSGKIRSLLGYREVAGPPEAMAEAVEWERRSPPGQSGAPAFEFDYQTEDRLLRGRAAAAGSCFLGAPGPGLISIPTPRSTGLD